MSEGPDASSVPSSYDAVESSAAESSSEDRDEPFTPEVGEVRKWFDYGTAGETRVYNYCPTSFVENGVKHVFYCTNKIEGNVTDFVGYRRGSLIDGKMTFSSQDQLQYVLGPTAESWDARHTCDPSVIKGEFKMGGETYPYLMAYLGCITSDNSKNEVGLAVAKAPLGPWVKCDSVNPIVPYDKNLAAWGTGQPSLVSVDHKGRVVLFYTVGNKTATYQEVREYDLSSLDSPALIRSKKVSEFGIKGSYTTIANADFAYDKVNKKILMVKGRQPFGGDQQSPSFIADTLDVYYMDDSESENKFDEVFRGNNAKDWKLMGSIDKSLTGFDRNHNAGLVTDEYGGLVEGDRIEVAFTRSDLSPNIWGYLSTYRLYSTSIGLTYKK